MEFPYGEKKFYAGDLFIIPRGLPHYEHAKKYKGREFTNLVGAFGGDFLDSHVAVQGENNRPSVVSWAKFKDKLKMISNMISCLDTIIQLSLSPKKSRAIKTAINSFGAGFLNLFYDFIKNSNDRQDEEPYKVMLCRHMVADRISDPSLNVSSLAQDIKCAPDYLSHLFKTETGWSLIEYINDNRIKRAVYLLSSSAMNISEVARACGYSDSAYFSRKFSQVTNISPREYRKKRR
jgi:AraC-like DNA-binding protein